jgi:hypothetical protein
MAVTPLNLPTYLEQANQERYNEEMNQTLRYWLNSNGFTGVPQLTQAQILAVAPMMQDSTLFYCTDYTPNPVYVGRINGNLVQFTTTVFP